MQHVSTMCIEVKFRTHGQVHGSVLLGDLGDAPSTGRSAMIRTDHSSTHEWLHVATFSTSPHRFKVLSGLQNF